MEDEPLEVPTDLVRELNDAVAARSCRAGQSLPFLCECARADCRDYVWLPCSRYEAIKAVGGHVVAGDHPADATGAGFPPALPTR